MSDEQVQQMMKTWRDALVKNMEELKLRQWCVTQSRHDLNPEQIWKFITAPFAEMFKD